ncbi:hypothetical protein GCM10011375_19560 [Hymenobacter qilianensis]|uniref:Uncharacterized protein n=1 Tax=Hymenobacter qilianensis TaxID=1385715 RepID=A0ACB5PRF0_9BACT|nr:hypothetical protein GCM10011375_19560 [Hymenobacter qilianensis]
MALVEAVLVGWGAFVVAGFVLAGLLAGRAAVVVWANRGTAVSQLKQHRQAMKRREYRCLIEEGQWNKEGEKRRQ